MKHHVFSAAVLLAWASGGISANTGSKGEITLDPNTVSPQTRMKWCNDQTASCATLCGGEGIGPNSCDHNTLDYACTCNNGSTPGLQYYIKTMPTYICEESYRVCVGAAGGGARAEKDCEEDIKLQCGTLDQSTLAQQKDADAGSAGPAASTGPQPSNVPTGTTQTGTGSTSTPSTSNPPGSPNRPDSSEEGGPSTGVKVGIAVVGFGIGFMILAGVALYFYKRGQNSRKGRDNGSIDESDTRSPTGKFEKLGSGDGWAAYELGTTERPAEMPAPAFHPVAELESPKVFIAELDDTSLHRHGTKTVSERGDTRHRM